MNTKHERIILGRANIYPKWYSVDKYELVMIKFTPALNVGESIASKNIQEIKATTVYKKDDKDSKIVLDEFSEVAAKLKTLMEHCHSSDFEIELFEGVTFVFTGEERDKALKTCHGWFECIISEILFLSAC